jgi:hypothetical protein
MAWPIRAPRCGRHTAMTSTGDTGVGAWTSPDPIGPFSGGRDEGCSETANSLYMYVLNDAAGLARGTVENGITNYVKGTWTARRGRLDE